MRADRIVAAAVAAGAAVLTAQLLLPPIVGLADNGDFSKVMRPAGLAYVEPEPDRYFRWAPSKFAFAAPRPDPDGYRTSETVLARAAATASSLVGASLFDIRALGALHAALLLLGLGFGIAATRDLAPAARWTAAILLVLVFTDVAYAAPLNSLYGQAASLVFFLVTVGIAALAIRRGGLPGAWLPAYFIAAALFVCSKPQEALQAPLLAALGAGLAGGNTRRRGTAIVLALLLLGVAIVYFRATPRELRRVALYHTVFTELLPNSADPGDDLRRLGLPEPFARYAGTTAYDGKAPLGDPAFREELDRLGYPALARIYLAHPDRALSVLRRAAWKGARMRPPFFGDLAKDAGRPERAQSRRFAVWSDLKFRLRPWTLAIWTALVAGSSAAALATWRRASPRGRLARIGLLALCAMASLELAVCAFADAHIELVRHLYVFHAMIDLVFVAAVVWTVQTVAARRSLVSRAARGVSAKSPSGGASRRGSDRGARVRPPSESLLLRPRREQRARFCSGSRASRSAAGSATQA